jgi:alkanesulfonate monooxygenase SsuD/methylene tetrahydromethanopterin reductase-like flavin-dependent oxidoreductase (luciferase family)
MICSGEEEKLMAKIQFGWAMPSGIRDKNKRRMLVDSLRRGLDLVANHYDSAWFVDHLQVGDRDLLEGWTAVSYLAALQPKLKFGHTVLCQSFRNPALLAKMAATLQQMSGGRFILGLGAGWHEEEYRAYGYDFPTPGQRVEQLTEYVQIIKALWTQKRASFAGKYYHVAEAYCEPKPDPLPTLMIGGSKPKMLRLIAREADWWNVSWTGIAEFREQHAEMERACAEVGRDPATLRRTWFGGCVCAATEAEVKRLNEGLNISTDNAFVGTPQQLIAQMQPFIELGIDYFMLGSGGFPDLTTLETLIGEVLPALNKE